MKASAKVKKKVGDGGQHLLPTADLQQLWFATMKREWSALVLLPASPELSVGELGEELARIGSMHQGPGVHFIDARGKGLSEISPLIVEMTEQAAHARKVIVAADALAQNQAAMPLVLSSDGVVLCVGLGGTDFASARRTLEMVGRERVVGSVAIHPGAAS